jgi:hypothetical protein
MLIAKAAAALGENLDALREIEKIAGRPRKRTSETDKQV